MTRRVLVTGGTGFIGRRVVPLLTADGADVLVPDSKSLDLLDATAVAAYVAAARPTHLLHLAWYAEHGKFWASPLNLDWVAASLSLLRAFATHGGTRAVLAGSCAEYDWQHGTGHLVEDKTPTRPGTLYGVCKNALREMAEPFAAAAGIRLAWPRIFFLYGPGEHPARLIPSILNPLLAGQPAVVRSGGHVRNLMHVDDVAAALVAILDSSVVGPVNVAAADAVRLGDVATLLGDLTGRPDLVRVEHAAGSPSNPPVLTADVARLSAVGFAARRPLRDGLSALLDPRRA